MIDHDTLTDPSWMTHDLARGPAQARIGSGSTTEGLTVPQAPFQGREEEAMESQLGWSPFDEVFAELERLRFENTALWEGQLELLALLEEHWERDRVRVENGVRARRMLRAVA